MFYDRAIAPSSRASQTSTPKVFPAPVRGWIRNELMARPKSGGAEVLDNWFPTPEGCRMRKGSSTQATIDAAVTHLTTYEAGAVSKIFATDATSIYDVTSPADPDVAVVGSVTGQSSGDWSSVQFTNAGGSYLVMVNGTDSMQRFNGSAWSTITSTITGVDTDDLSQVWKYSSRLWFVGDGMSAWYLSTNAIDGAATEFPLGGIFSLGGSLLFGCSWSSDAGDGLDDYCVFITTEGEAAVYQGDPASTFSKVGVYKIGKPIHKNGWFRAGGDIAVITDDAIVSLGAAVQKDRAALLATAITYPIEEAWRLAVEERSGVLPFSCVVWPSKTMLVVGVPASGSQLKMAYVANTRTGAWCRFTGWDTRAVTVFDDKLFFGTRDGEVVRGEVSGADQGATYTASLLSKFDDFKSIAEKTAVHARLVARANQPCTPQLFANADYDVDLPTPLSADADEAASVWDVGVWDTSTWGSRSDTKSRQSEWQSVGAVGQALACGLQITSGRVTAPDIELIALHLVTEEGEMI